MYNSVHWALTITDRGYLFIILQIEPVIPTAEFVGKLEIIAMNSPNGGVVLNLAIIAAFTSGYVGSLNKII